MARQTLVSESNPLLRRVRQAARRGFRTEEGFALAEGPHLLAEAVRSGIEIAAVILAESARLKPPEGVRVLFVADRVFAKLACTESPQGVLALVRPREWTLAQVLQDRSLIVALDGVQDPGNAGAVLRASEAFGASGVVLLKGTVNPYNPKCLRASAGSVFRVPLASGVAPSGLLLADLTLYAADPRAARTILEVDLRGPCAFVIGAEGRGVSPAIRRAAAGVRIPTSGVESLNAAMSAGILLYEARRQRGFG